MIKKLKEEKGAMGFNYLVGAFFLFLIFALFLLCMQVFFVGSRVKEEMRECIFNTVSIQHTATYSGSREYNSIARKITDDDMNGVYGETTDSGEGTSGKGSEDSIDDTTGGTDEDGTEGEEAEEVDNSSIDVATDHVVKSNLDQFINKVYSGGVATDAASYIDGKYCNEGATWEVKSNAYSVVDAIVDHFGLEAYDIGGDFISGISDSTPALVKFSNTTEDEENDTVVRESSNVLFALSNFEVYYNDKIDTYFSRPFQIGDDGYKNGVDDFTVTVKAELYVPLSFDGERRGAIKMPIKVKASLAKYFNNEHENSKLD